MDYADLRFIAVAEQKVDWPPYIGQTLRGAFGMSLKAVACQETDQCREGCVHPAGCAYAVLFDGLAPPERDILRKYPQIPQPFVLVAEGSAAQRLRDEGHLEFTIRLLGPAIDMYPYVIRTGMRMLQYGLGGKRVPFRLLAIHDSHGPVFEDGATAVQAIHRQTLQLPPEPSPPITGLALRFETPLRLSVDGQRSNTPSLESILAAIVRRCRILNHFYGDGTTLATPGLLLDAAAAATTINCDLLSANVRRYSGRQKRAMVLDGITGSIAYRWPPDQPGPQGWLGLASVLHVGKATTFGFGQIAATFEP